MYNGQKYNLLVRKSFSSCKDCCGLVSGVTQDLHSHQISFKHQEREYSPLLLLLLILTGHYSGHNFLALEAFQLVLSMGADISESLHESEPVEGLMPTADT
jgi:hypothetical protein